MTRVFDVGQLPGVPAADLCAVLLTARTDLDLRTAAPARAEVRLACAGPADAALLDITRAYVGVVVIHCILEITRRVRGPLAVVGAPQWLVEIGHLVGLPPIPHLRTVEAAVAALRLNGRSGPAPDGRR
jgi:hypothetical protein